MPSRPTKEQ